MVSSSTERLIKEAVACVRPGVWEKAPSESSIAAIEWGASVGAVPTVCVFRPLKGTDYQDEPAPDTEAMLPVFAALYECSMKHGLPIGLAPNVHVSLVMLPWECRWLVPGRVRRRYALKEARLALMRRVFSRTLYRQLRRHDARRRCGIEPTTNER